MPASRRACTVASRRPGWRWTRWVTAKRRWPIAAAAAYDVIVLDVMLPSRDGFAVARSLREKKMRSPILMLTGRGAVEDRVHGLDVGADDYLVKPFALRELIARIKALSRRHLPDR